MQGSLDVGAKVPSQRPHCNASKCSSVRRRRRRQQCALGSRETYRRPGLPTPESAHPGFLDM